MWAAVPPKLIQPSLHQNLMATEKSGDRDVSIGADAGKILCNLYDIITSYCVKFNVGEMRRKDEI